MEGESAHEVTSILLEGLDGEHPPLALMYRVERVTREELAIVGVCGDPDGEDSASAMIAAVVAAALTNVLYNWLTVQRLAACSLEFVDRYVARWALWCYRARVQHEHGLPVPFEGRALWHQLFDGVELSDRYRVELDLVYEFGCSPQEVAAILRLPGEEVSRDLSDIYDLLATAAAHRGSRE